MTPVRQLANKIDDIYANVPWYEKPKRKKHLSFYSYCGHNLDVMDDETASNILQTRFSYSG